MKHRITQKLILYFTSVLLLFSAIVGSSFLTLFVKQSTQLYKEELEDRARKISETMSTLDYEQFSSGLACVNGHDHSMGFGAYVDFLDHVSLCDIWIIDRKDKTINAGTEGNPITYEQIPPDAAELIKKVFKGKIAFTESFGVLLEEPSVSVGAPIYDKNNRVVAAVLLHTQTEEMTSAINSGMSVLYISLVGAMALSIFIAVLLSRRFAKPLKQMQVTTQRLAEGDYKAKTNINQDDEVGSLAGHIDILAQKLDEASRESAKLEQMRKDYIANISHELRTPVTVLRGSLEALCDGVVTDKEKMDEYLQQMLSESIHLERMVNDLLELSRLQNLDYNIEKSPLWIGGVLSDAVRSIRNIAVKKGICLEMHTAHKDMEIKGDYGRLRQMFMIVLGNAVKFSSRGQTVNVHAENAGSNLLITIVDNGIGIKEEELPHIFERFYKSGSVHNQKGTGLGLAIAKQIAERHSIEIEVKSTPNVETEFLFKISAP